MVSGPAGGELHYPVPWADGPEQSFMVGPEEVRSLAQAAGFEVSDWLEGMDVVQRIGAMAASGRPGLAAGVEGVTLALVMPDFDERMAGLARNVQDQRIALVMVVLSRP